MISGLLRLLLWLAASSHCLASIAPRGSYDYGQQAASRLAKRDIKLSQVVTGAPRVNGSVGIRHEIRVLEADEDLWNLFILGLNWMQYMNQTDIFSWYQVAGIHGAPGHTWGGVNATPGNEMNGYCRHVSVLFPTWHRPYLALYEQILYSIIQYIASLYPEEQRDHFQDVARRFRLPYWDWAATPDNGSSILPESVGGSPNVNVSGPRGYQEISNPLFSYIFKPFDPSIFPMAPFDMWNETKRSANPSDGLAAMSDNSISARTLDNLLPTHQQRLYNIFSNYPSYVSFSNEGWEPANNNGTFDSLESLHDSVHTASGGVFGHLAIIGFSGFDPLFVLHHVNVDRIFTMWQLLYNESWIVSTKAAYGTHTTSAGQMEDSTTPLTPFFVNETSFWTSDMVRDHEVLGYTYKDVQHGNRSHVIRRINQLYTLFSPATMPSRLRRRSTTGEMGSIARHWGLYHHTGRRRSAHLPLNAVFDDNDQYYEWVANIQVEKNALSGSFQVYLFLGDVPDDPSDWPFSDHFVGSFAVFAHNGLHGKMTKRQVAGTIPMTSALLDMVSEGSPASVRPADVVPFLRESLKFRVAMVDGSAAPEDVDGLVISISSSAVKAPSSVEQLPRWGGSVHQFDLVA